MLDPEAPDERRDQIASEARTRIESNANLKADRSWGMRKLAYEILQRNEADYRFFRFETESPLLEELNHNLKITDGVLRFRLFKVDPDSPVIEPPPPVSLASSSPREGRGGRRDGRGGPGARPPREERSEPVDSNASDPPAETSDPPAETSDPPAETSDAPTETSDAPTETSDAPTETSDAPTDPAPATADAVEAPPTGDTPAEK